MDEERQVSAASRTRDHIVWSFVATLFLTASLRIAQASGFTRIDIPLIVGTMFTPQRDRAKVIGSFVHALNGWWLGSIYIVAFHSLRRSSALLGGLIGFVHGLFVLVTVLPLLPGVHPRMASDFTGPQPTSGLEPPGFMALNYGRRTPIVTLIAHVIYGAIIGHFYEVGRVREGEGGKLLGHRPGSPGGDLAALGARER
jgi:hypothetical protein